MVLVSRAEFEDLKEFFKWVAKRKKEEHEKQKIFKRKKGD